MPFTSMFVKSPKPILKGKLYKFVYTNFSTKEEKDNEGNIPSYVKI